MSSGLSSGGLSIYTVLEVAAEVQGFGDLSHVGLPDEKPPDEGGLRWAPGALEGVLGHHAGPDSAPAAEIAGLVVAAGTGGEAELRQLHDAAAEHDSTASYVDPMIDLLAEHRPTVDSISAVGRRLLHEGTARGAVKLGIALLGLTRATDERDAVLLLGRHDEFTLFAAVALSNMEPSPDLTLWELAQHVTGWGRIHIVERLGNTTDPAIRAWLLREGFRNTVMNEYLAYIAATTGGLAEALAEPDVDDALFDAAGEILEALLSGGPARDIDDYSEGPAVARRYAMLARDRARTLGHLRAALSLVEWLDDDEGDWDGRSDQGWTPARRDDITAILTELVSRPSWVQLAAAALESDDATERWAADNVLQRLGYSTFEHHLRELDVRPLREQSWLIAAAQCPPERADELIAAARTLPLAQIGSGPGMELGMSGEFVADRCLDAVVRALPGLGALPWDLITCSLSSRTRRTRHGALYALERLPRDLWPSSGPEELAAARSTEPDDKIRAQLDTLLQG